MRRSRSHLNNLAANQPASHGLGPAPQVPAGVSQQIEEIGRRLSALGVHTQSHATGDGNVYGHAAHGVGPDAYSRSPASREQGGYPQYNMQAGAFPVSAPAPELDHIRSSLEQIGSKLNAMSRSETGHEQNARHSEVLVRQNEQITSELLEMRKQIASAGKTDNSGLVSEMEKIRQSLEASHAEITRQLSEGRGGGNDSKYAQVVEASHERLSGELQGLRSVMDEFADMSGNSVRALEARHDDFLRRIDDLQQGINVAAGNPELYREVVENSYREIAGNFADLKETVMHLQQSRDDMAAPDFTQIEMRLEEITRAVVALSAGNQNLDNLERIEARIADIGKTVSAMQPGDSDTHFANIEREIAGLREQLATAAAPAPGFDPSALERQMSEIRENLNELSTRVADNGAPVTDFADMAAQISQLSDKFDNRMPFMASAESEEGGSIDLAALIGRLDDMVEQVAELKSRPLDVSAVQTLVDQVPDHSDAFASLERQLGDILNRLAEVDGEGASLEPITERLAGIEQQIGASRDIAVEVAAQAAEEAIERAIRELPAQAAQSGSSVDAQAIESLTHDLRRWQETVSGANAENHETFEAVRDVLNTIADRLSQVEAGMQSAMTGGQAVSRQEYQAEPERADDAPVSHEASGLYDNEDAQELYAEPAVSGHASDQPGEHQTHHSAPVTSQPSANTNPLYAAAVGEANVQAADPSEENLPRVETPAMEMAEMPDAPVSDDFVEEDMPIEPGNGAPDLAALVKQANERRKSSDKSGSATSGMDFLASARRAAQAAAQEASMVQEQIEVEKKQSLLTNLPGLIAKNKKVLMYGAAAILIVVMAIPVASRFLSPDPAPVSDDAAVPAIEETLDSPSVEESTLVEPDAGLSGTGLNEDTATDPAADVEELPQVDGAAESSVDATADEADAAWQEENEETPEGGESLQSATLEITEIPAENIPSFDTGELDFANDALKSAVSAGDPAAVFEIGRRYSEGAGTAKNLEKASDWYERSAQLGYAPAQYIIGNFNEKGIGVEKNMARAVSWYELAAESGNVVAMHNLGVIYATPGTVADEPDMENAFRWFNEAADHGVRDSQVNMGIFHTRGIGTNVDLVEAYKWFAVASASGDVDAKSKLTVIKEALRPEQLAEAKALVESWKPETADKAANEVQVSEAWKDQTAQVAQPVPVSKTTIAQMQAVLARLGYNPGPADGIMGQRTRDAIVAYRKKAGLDGGEQVDAALLRSLTAAISG